jgi:hypothetical protein
MNTEWDVVAIAGERIIAHTNRYFARLRYPGQSFETSAHDSVRL